MKQWTRRNLLLASGAALSGACATRRPTIDAGIQIDSGSGSFTMPGGLGHEGHAITVHYHRPATFSRRSPILLVLPGAGRNGDDYRDAWIASAEQAGVLVLSPSYPERDYDNAAYQMCGVIRNLTVGKPLAGSTASVLYLRDEDIRFDVNPNREQWLFNDFERLFDLARRATDSVRRGYDMFGHSAGGQILHRHALLCAQSRARRIVAANSGFYTLPDLSQPQPSGLAGLGLDEAWLRRAFSQPLTLLLGESDNDSERGGIHLHTPLIDRQGTNRLDRGRHFHAFSAARAQAIGADFRWQLRTVPNVGHDYRGMTDAAAALLYG